MRTKKIIMYVALLLGGIVIFLFGCTLINPGPAVPWYDHFTGGNQWGTGGILSGVFLFILGIVLVVCSIEELEEWI